MQYLVERYDTEYKISYPKGSREWFDMNNWLFFQNAGVGPMQGQASKSHLYTRDQVKIVVREELEERSDGMQ